MNATLIFNANAGGNGDDDTEALADALRDAGYEPACRATEDPSEIDEVLDATEGLVIAAGGDGTVREIVKRLVERDRPLALLPLGTANNLARHFDLEGDPTDLLRRLDEPVKHAFDVGRIEGPWGEDIFLEGVGLGLYADVLEDYEPERGKSVARAAETLGDVVPDYEAHRVSARLDGEDISGLLVGLEVLNVRAVGPRMHLAPDADPCDGKLDVVRIAKPDDVSLAKYLAKLVRNEFDELPNVSVQRGERLELDWTGRPLHLDAELRGDDDEASWDEASGKVVVSVLAGAIPLWLPRSS